MTAKRKARVGDTIRHNGKNPATAAGQEYVANRVVDSASIWGDYWVGYTLDAGYEGSAWESQFDIVEPAPEFKKGDRVKLTPKDGGESVIYGSVQSWDSTQAWVYLDGDVDWGAVLFQTSHWNIELVKPSTEEILNGLGRNAVVLLRDDPDAEYYPFTKIDGHWYLIDQNFRTKEISALRFTNVSTIANYIDNSGFEIIFEGIKDE